MYALIMSGYLKRITKKAASFMVTPLSVFIE